MFATIEDFMWFMVAMAGLPAAAGGAGPSSLRSSAGASAVQLCATILGSHAPNVHRTVRSEAPHAPLERVA